MTTTPTYEENTPLSPDEYATVVRFGLDQADPETQDPEALS